MIGNDLRTSEPQQASFTVVDKYESTDRTSPKWTQGVVQKMRFVKIKINRIRNLTCGQHRGHKREVALLGYVRYY